MINIVMEIEKSFNLKLDVNEIVNIKSYKSIKKILISKGVEF